MRALFECSLGLLIARIWALDRSYSNTTGFQSISPFEFGLFTFGEYGLVCFGFWTLASKVLLAEVPVVFGEGKNGF